MKSKVITLCGSLKYQDKMMEMAEELQYQGYCVLSVIYPTKDKNSYTKKQLNAFKKMHMKRISISDAIYVLNIDGYIGDSVKKEIEYAENLGKEIMYFER